MWKGLLAAVAVTVGIAIALNLMGYRGNGPETELCIERIDRAYRGLTTMSQDEIERCERALKSRLR